MIRIVAKKTRRTVASLQGEHLSAIAKPVAILKYK